jgi:hypothetical protein
MAMNRKSNQTSSPTVELLRGRLPPVPEEGHGAPDFPASLRTSGSPDSHLPCRAFTHVLVSLKLIGH